MSALAATPDQTPASPVNTPANATSTEAADAAAELERFYAEHEDDDAAAPATAAAPETPAATATAAPATADGAAPATAPAAPAAVLTEDDFWNQPDNNPKLPKSLQGKSRREVYEANVGSRWEAMQAGQQKNDAERELQVTRALLDTFRQSAAPATPAPTPIPGHQALGLETPEAAFGQVDKVVERLPGFIEQRASEIADQRIAPLAQTVAQLQQADIVAKAEAARLSVGTQHKIPPDVYESIAPDLKLYLYNNKLHPHDPRNWEAALMDFRERTARLHPQTATLPTTAPPVGTATSTAAAPAAARRPVSTGDRKADAEIKRQLITFFGHTDGTPKFDEAFKKAVVSYRQDRRNNDE